MIEKSRLSEIALFDIWGEERVRALLEEVTLAPAKLGTLARVRFSRNVEVEEAVRDLLEAEVPEEQQLLALSLPDDIQEVIILDCVMELNRAIRRTIHDLN